MLCYGVVTYALGNNEHLALPKLNGHDPHAYLKDVLTRLPTHMNSRLDELLPHRWTPV
jgi:hypothetical protein